MGERTVHSPIGTGRCLIVLTAVLASVLLFFPSGRPSAQANPFFDSPTPAPAAPLVSVPTPRLRALIDAQRTIREVLADAVDRSGRGGRGVPALMALAFAYGLLHALGPGHRKVALAAYFLARPSQPLRGVVAGASVAFLHAAAALALIYGLYYLFQGTVTTAFASISSVLELASYAAIILIGLILLALAVREIIKERRSRRRSFSAEQVEVGDRKTLTAIILSSGMVPCPGTALILIFCLSQSLPGIGVLAALSMSAGMAAVTVGVSLAAIYGKRGLLSALPRGSRLGGLLHHGLEIAGAVLIVVFGLFMLSPYLVV